MKATKVLMIAMVSLLSSTAVFAHHDKDPKPTKCPKSDLKKNIMHERNKVTIKASK